MLSGIACFVGKGVRFAPPLILIIGPVRLPLKLGRNWLSLREVVAVECPAGGCQCHESCLLGTTQMFTNGVFLGKRSV